MIAHRIVRTGRATSAIRHLELVTDLDEKGNEFRTKLSTPIEKIEWGLSFRHGGGRVPMEQYAFRVGAKVYERFADATAAVLRRHRVTVSKLEQHQRYVEKALAILAGAEEIRIMQVVPQDAQPAIGAINGVASA